MQCSIKDFLDDLDERKSYLWRAAEIYETVLNRGNGADRVWDSAPVKTRDAERELARKDLGGEREQARAAGAAANGATWDATADSAGEGG